MSTVLHFLVVNAFETRDLNWILLPLLPQTRKIQLLNILLFNVNNGCVQIAICGITLNQTFT